VFHIIDRTNKGKNPALYKQGLFNKEKTQPSYLRGLGLLNQGK